MKSILMSIQPYYAYLEMKGIKTVEMRKTLPKDKEWSGKVKVYVSQNKKSFNRIPKEDRVWFKQYVGKVAYEFVCDYVEKEAVAFTEICNFGRLYHCRLSLAELKKYAGKRTSLYYWHITALKIYDNPRELGEFKSSQSDFSCKYRKNVNSLYSGKHTVLCTKINDGFLRGCDLRSSARQMDCPEYEYKTPKSITRPPQSWQYIETPDWEREE